MVDREAIKESLIETELYFYTPLMMIQKARFQAAIVFIASVLLSGCSVLRNIPDSQYLLNKNIIKTDHPEYRENINAVIKQKPNRKILGIFRFHLGVYFLAQKAQSKSGKDSSKFYNWLKTAVGEEPVLLDSNLTHKSSQQLEIFMQNNGYFNAKVHDSIVRKKTTCKVYYIIESGEAYRIRNFYYSIKDSSLAREVYLDSAQTLIRSGNIYSSAALQKERDRINSKLRNRGYYFFNPQYISFTLDSGIGNKQLDLYLSIANPRINSRDSLISGDSIPVHHKSILKNIYIEMDYDPIQSTTEFEKDTIVYDGYYFLSNSKKNYLYKPNRLREALYIKSDSLFSQANSDLTYSRLGDLAVFRFINIKYEPEQKPDSLGRIPLRGFIYLAPSPRQEYKIEAEGTNSGGNLGVAGTVSYKNKNIFRGAESLDLRIKGGLELQRNFNDTTYQSLQAIPFFNAYELGPDLSLNFPRFLGFDIKNTMFSNKNTSFTAGYNIQNRPEYYRELANLSFYWSTRYGKSTRLFFYPAEINYLRVKLDPAFRDQLIKNDVNILLGYVDQLIVDGRVSYIYSNQELNKTRDYSYFRMNFESAGNSINAIFKRTPVFNVTYAQYVRPDFDYRHYHNFTASDQLAFRFASGLGYAYGNSEIMPFEKSFFAGGPNDIRAWPSRSIGPGSSVNNDIYERFGELKIISNLEYRFDIFRKLEGALFADAGNIWLVRNIAERPGGKFQLNTFADEVALGTGFGLRFDFTFFIIRLDGGLKVKDPSKPVGDRWVFKPDQLSDITFNFGIGYPF